VFLSLYVYVCMTINQRELDGLQSRIEGTKTAKNWEIIVSFLYNTKCFKIGFIKLVKSLASLEWAEDSEANTETRPPDLWPLAKLLCFPACFSSYKTQVLPVTQLVMHVILFHLVIAENRRPETLSLSHGWPLL
jgi:hypothetical protein